MGGQATIRKKWSNPVEFVLSVLGFAIGLGNVWRFPFLCYRNGGGAFLVPYLVMLFGCGLPLVLMELTLGQYSSQGPMTVWKCSPLFKGLGIGMVICTFISNIYYNMVTGWALYYLQASLRSILPWQCCWSSWATDSCVSFGACYTTEAENGTGSTHLHTRSGNSTPNGAPARFAADDYYHNEVLKISSSLYDLGTVQWHLVLALLAAWTIVFFVLIKGIKSLGKIAYFTSTFPFLLLVTLFCRAVVEPGAAEGLKFFFTPKWEMLRDAKVWSDAAAQIFFSTAVCCGGVITLASFNKFHNNLVRDGLIVVLGNGATSLFSGSVVFSILGLMAHSQNTTIDSVVTSGPGLTFIIYPQAVTILPLSPLWSALFFIMLSMLALSSMFPCTEIIITSITDQFVKLRAYQVYVTLGVCGALFLLGTTITTNGGIYILTLLDTYAVGYGLMLLGIFELAVISWRYGAGKLARNLKEMIGDSCSTTFYQMLKYVWQIVTPALLIFAIVFTAIFSKPLQYGDYIYPPWINGIGWFLTSISILPIFVYAIFKFLTFKFGSTGSRMSIWRCLVHLTSPTENWKPAPAEIEIGNK